MPTHSHRTIASVVGGMFIVGILIGLPSNAAPPSAVTPENSIVAQSPSSVPADGVTAITVTATVRDQYNNPMNGVTVTITSSRGSADTIVPPSATTNASGVAIFQLTSGTVGSPSLTTTANGVTLISPIPTFTQNIAAGGGHSTASQNPSSVTADGSSVIIITVRARNSFDGPVPNKLVRITSSRGASVDTIVPASGATTNAAGDTTLTIASCTVGSPTLTITIDPIGNPITVPSPIPTFTANTTPHAGNTSVAASSSSAPADNVTTVRLTATVQNACGQPLAGVNVATVSSRGSADTIIPSGSGVATNASGVAVTEVRSGTLGTSTYTTTAGGVALPDDTVNVTYVAASPPPDAAAPIVGTILPSNITANVNTIISASYSDNVGVASCDLILDETNVGAMSLNSPGGAAGTASRTVNVAVGNHTARASCRDAAGNTGQGPNATITANPAPDVTPPSVGSITPTAVTANQATVFSVSYSDNAGIARCTLFSDGSLVGDMSVEGTGDVSGVANILWTLSAGSHTLHATCSDTSGNTATGSATTIVASTPVTPPADTTPSPSASAVDASPTTVLANNSNLATVTVTVKNASGVGLNDKTVTLATNRPATDTIAIVSGTTNAFGQAIFNVRSSGAGQSVFTATVGGVIITDTASVTFSASSSPASPDPAAGRLYKLACPPGAEVNHPCKAVYYIGNDRKRHSFPNDKVYFTWYADFSEVLVVTQSQLSSYPLGKNVTYRPGVKLVKFSTLAKTYAVSRGGVLRWITSEDVARSLYGTSWNRQVDDVSDAFFTNYAFGADIVVSADYSASAELATAQTIDASL